MINRVLISGGGTGGHIFPAIAIAKEIEKRYSQVDILFVGSSHRMEMEKIPEAGYTIKGLWISGIQRNLSFNNLLFPIKLIGSLLKSFFILKNFKPSIVIGTGGFASGPILWIASLLNIPTLIQEQNSYPGITNRILSSKVNSICVAYEGLDKFFPKEKLNITGNPIRSEIESNSYDRDSVLKEFGLKKDKPIILFLGGSLGAKKINETVIKNIEWFKKKQIQLIWQTGEFYFDYCIKFNHLLGEWGIIKPFIKKMGSILSISDIVVSRSGAIALSEICALGKTSILIPSPNVAENHQTKNACALLYNSAALMVKENNIDTELFTSLDRLIKDKSLRDKISINCKKMGRFQAVEKIVDQVESLING